jgi:pimeloyl-ACP methyl ester carboxylesterase
MTQSVFKSPEARAQFRAVYCAILSRFPFAQTYVETAYGRTFVLRAGEERNPPAVVLHGSCSNSVFMAPEIMALSQTHSVYAVDIVGEAGNSADVRPRLETDDFALWLRDVLDGLAVKSAVLVGNSLGGWTALKFAVSFPERVSSLVLVAPGGLSGQNREITDRAAKAKANDETLTVDASVTGAALPKEVEDFMNLIFASYNPFTDILPVFSDGQLKKLIMPVLFVGGENDAMLDAPAAARRLEKLLPNAEIRLLPNAGHMILNAPEYILPFLSKVSQP